MADLQAFYRLKLQDEFTRRVQRNSRYSRNAFARDLDLGPTYLSKLMNGKILLSLDLADQITRLLGFDAETRKEFLLSAAEEQSCHALYLIDPTLTDCDPAELKTNLEPQSRRGSRSPAAESQQRSSPGLRWPGRA